MGYKRQMLHGPYVRKQEMEMARAMVAAGDLSLGVGSVSKRVGRPGPKNACREGLGVTGTDTGQLFVKGVLLSTPCARTPT